MPPDIVLVVMLDRYSVATADSRRLSILAVQPVMSIDGVDDLCSGGAISMRIRSAKSSKKLDNAVGLTNKAAG